jgi:hypothetical protein
MRPGERAYRQVITVYTIKVDFNAVVLCFPWSLRSVFIFLVHIHGTFVTNILGHRQWMLDGGATTHLFHRYVPHVATLERQVDLLETAFPIQARPFHAKSFDLIILQRVELTSSSLPRTSNLASDLLERLIMCLLNLPRRSLNTVKILVCLVKALIQLPEFFP